jgi:hypothetical protein
MANDAGILEIGEIALEDMIVSAADADMPDGDAHPAILQFRTGGIDKRQLVGRYAGNGTHEISSLGSAARPRWRETVPVGVCRRAGFGYALVSTASALME